MQETQETWIQSLGQEDLLEEKMETGGSDGKESPCNVGDPGLIPGREDPLEKETATHSSILAWKILWTEKSGLSMGTQTVRHGWVCMHVCAHTHTQ